jgi:hypothetical protein
MNPTREPLSIGLEQHLYPVRRFRNCGRGIRAWGSCDLVPSTFSFRSASRVTSALDGPHGSFCGLCFPWGTALPQTTKQTYRLRPRFCLAGTGLGNHERARASHPKTFKSRSLLGGTNSATRRKTSHSPSSISLSLRFDIMPISGADKIKQQSAEELARIAQISMDVRQAVRNALPAPPEQFFTMMVPGKVLNLDVSPIPPLTHPRRAGYSCEVYCSVGLY